MKVFFAGLHITSHFCVKDEFSVVADTTDIYKTISIKRLPTYKAIKGDITSLCYYFEAGQIDQMIWVPGKYNLADPMT